MAGCYPDQAGLSTLRRSITLDRSNESVIVDDSATFGSDMTDPSFESVFVTYAPIEETVGGIDIRGDRTRTHISFEPSPETIDVERLADAVDFSSDDTVYDTRDVWRARVTAPMASDAYSRPLRTTILPEFES